MQHSSRNKLKAAALPALALILALFIALGVRGSGKPQAVLGTVTRGDLIQRVTISGTVTSNHKTVISAPYNGYVRRIYVETGDLVKEGDPIVSVAQSLKGSAEEVYPLRAPFKGIVTQILKTEGEYVEQTGGGLVRVDDLTRLYVEASSPEIEIGKLKEGQEAVIKASAVLARAYKGTITHISLAAKDQKDWDRSRVEFAALIEVRDADARLKPGMSVIADIAANEVKGALTLRHEFVQKDGDKYFAVTEAGERRQIEVGLQNEEVIEVKRGLSEGDRVRQTDFLSILKEQ